MIEVDKEQEACLQEVVDETDVGVVLSAMASESTASDSARFFEMMDDLLGCLPEVFEAGVDGADDYADWLEGAARVVLGGSVEGVVDYDGDLDVFVFEATEGVLYEIVVTLGTLSDSRVAVYGEDEWELGRNDDRGDGSPGSRLVWKAPVSGDFYVGVSGDDGEGSYTLTVGVSDVVDDYTERINAERAIYAAAVRHLVEFGGFPVGPLTNYSEILIVDHFPRTCFHNGIEWICDYGDYSDPVDRFSDAMKSEISTAIKEIAPRFRFIASRAQFVRDNGGIGGEPGQPGSVIVTLDHAEFYEHGATVRVDAWCGDLCYTGVTYLFIEEPDGWAVAETLNVVGS